VSRLTSALGATVSLDQLEHDPHPTLARLREREPVAWIPPLNGWLVTRYDLVLAAMRDPGAFHRRRPAVLDRPGARRPRAGHGEHPARTLATVPLPHPDPQRRRAQREPVQPLPPRDVPSLRTQTHSDFNHADMKVYRARLRKAGACPT
jgi:cytochrome P450